MYRGYSISKDEIENCFKKYSHPNDDYIEDFYNKQKKSVKNNMDNIILGMVDDVLDAKKIQDDWFPEIDTHVFISHSHADIKLAKRFAGWLYDEFGITSFIDSCVWKYADDLLKIIDNKYCKKPTGNTYYYDKRNLSTAHVHMLLMTALNKMIYKSECVFFLNTPNSNVGEGINSKTLSPWIYGEIEISRTIGKIPPKRERKIPKFRQGGILEKRKSLEIMEYPLDMGHFYSLNSGHLLNWKANMLNLGSVKKNPLRALDELYKITPKKEII